MNHFKKAVHFFQEIRKNANAISDLCRTRAHGAQTMPSLQRCERIEWPDELWLQPPPGRLLIASRQQRNWARIDPRHGPRVPGWTFNIERIGSAFL